MATSGTEDAIYLPILIAFCNIGYVVSFNCSCGLNVAPISPYANLELPYGKQLFHS